MPTVTPKRLLLSAAIATFLLARLRAGPQDHTDHSQPVYPLPEKTGPLRKAMLLLRESKTAEARKELEQQRRLHPADAEILYQIARSYLIDFYRLQAPEQRRVALGLAMENLG